MRSVANKTKHKAKRGNKKLIEYNELLSFIILLLLLLLLLINVISYMNATHLIAGEKEREMITNIAIIVVLSIFSLMIIVI